MKKAVSVLLSDQSIKYLDDLSMYILCSKSAVVDSFISMMRERVTPEQVKDIVDQYHIDGRRK